MAEAIEYGRSMAYEIFICRAFKTHGYNRLHKAHLSNLTNLIDSEKGRSNVAHLPSYQKQLVQVKDNIAAAIDKFLSPSWRLKPEEQAVMLALKQRLLVAATSDQVIEIIDAGLELTNKYKDK